MCCVCSSSFQRLSFNVTRLPPHRPDGTTTLCNRCGVQFRLGRLVPRKNFPFLVKIKELPAHLQKMYE